MAKITRRRLARGTKLTRQAPFDVLDDAATALQGAIVAEQIEERFGTFRVNLTIPYIDSRYFSRTSNTNTRFAIPFMLPPLQQFFSRYGETSEDDPEIRLIEMAFSFDQRQEAAAIVGSIHGSGNTGYLFVAGVETYNFRISLVTKNQYVFDTSTGFNPESELASIELPAEHFATRNFRFNPAIVEVNQSVNPYKTLMLVLDARDLDETGLESMLVSPTFSFKFRYELHAGSQGSANVQNVPLAHTNTPTAPTVNITTPAQDALIEADANDGLQTNLKTIDAVLQAKLEGGANQGGDIPVTEHIVADTCYDIIAVPMFCGYGDDGYISAAEVTAGNAPDSAGGAPYVEDQQDEAVVPLHHPIIVHHAYAVVNYASPTAGGINTGGLHPASASLTNTVSVGIGVGRAADNHDYQLIAGTAWTPVNKANITVDRIAAMAGSTNTAEATNRWDYEILQLPITTGPQGVGVGHYAQGKPFYAGWAQSRMWDRSDVGSGDGSDKSFTGGAEQFLSFRWRFVDTNGLGTAEGAGGVTPASAVYSGYNGHWIMLVCEKPTVGMIDESFPQ